jgi:hypothetical protein
MTVIGPALPSGRVPLSTGGSRLAKVLFVGASAFCVLWGLVSHGTGFLGFAGFLLLIGWRYVPLSEVETDGLFLYVSQLRASARVSLTDVAAVRLGWWPRTFRVIVELRAETPVGRRVVYEPPMDWMATAYDHRAIRELRALIAQARAAEAHPGSGAS